MAEPSPRPPWPFPSEPVFGSPQGDGTRPRFALGAPVLGPAEPVSWAAASQLLDFLGLCGLVLEWTQWVCLLQRPCASKVLRAAPGLPGNKTPV